MGSARHGRWWLVAGLAVLAVAPAAAAQEAVFTVTRTDDPVPDGCRPDDCSLREAVEAANAQRGADVVALPAGVFELTRLDRRSVTPQRQGLYVGGEMVLRGAGQRETAIDLSRLPPLEGQERVGPGIAARDASLTLEHLAVRDAPEPGLSASVLIAVDTAVTLRSVAIIDARSGAISVINLGGAQPLLVEDSLFAGNAGPVIDYDGADRPSGTPAVRVRRSVFRDNDGPALDLAVHASGIGDAGSYEAVVEDSLFHGNGQGIVGFGRIRVSTSSFVGNSSSAMEFDRAPVLLERVLVQDNIGAFGGGVAAGNLTVLDSVFRGNHARSDGGAIDMYAYELARPTLEVSRSVFVNNSARRGGAIGAVMGAARLTNVTLSGNVANDVRDGFDHVGAGAAVYIGESATASLLHTTVVGSRGRLGAFHIRGRLDVVASVVAGTVTLEGDPAPHCTLAEGGMVVSGGSNLADEDSCGLDSSVGDRMGEPRLGPLVSTGGTFAHLPLAGSPAVDAAERECPALDQRGVARPLDGNRDGVFVCDVGAVEGLSGRVGRVAGLDRVTTAVALSQSSIGDQQAATVVLARSDGFADGLAGGPLAAAGDGPLLLTGREELDPLVAAELQRVLPTGGEVVLLGGPAALRPRVEDRIVELGYRPVRVAGEDRYATAVAVARRLGDPGLVLLASGTDFPDALSAGGAAATARGAVLLTAGDQLPASTRAYLDRRPDAERIAVGGPAAAADPGAEPVSGRDRYETSVAVARRFHDLPARAGVASGEAFPDALAAGPDSAARRGPLLLTAADRLPAPVADYLAEAAPTLVRTAGQVRIYGGENAVSLQVETEVDAAVRG